MHSRRPTGLALFTLAAAAFVYVTSESFPVGLLPQLAAGLHVRESTVGLLLTVYACVVALTAIPLVVVSGRIGRRTLIVVTVATLAVSMFAFSVAPDYPLALAARLIAALAHGVFWSILVPIAASLVPGDRHGRATATVFVGNSLALVLGSPLTTALGQWLGWRTAAALLGVVAALCALGLRLCLPAGRVASGPRVQADAVAAAREDRPTARQLLREGPLTRVCVTTLMLVVADFALYTYISVFIKRDSGLGGIALTLVLLANGLAGLVGILVVGRVTDARPRRATMGCAAVFAAAVLALGCVGAHLPAVAIAVVLVWGGAFTAIPVVSQAAVLRVARGSGDVASSVYVVAFQIGIAGGALAGGAALDAGVLGWAPFGAAALAAVAVWLIRRSPRAFPIAGGQHPDLLAAQQADEPANGVPADIAEH